MKSLFDDEHYALINARIRSLKADEKALWGEFNAPRMVCHLLDIMEYVLGIVPARQEFVPGPPMIIRHFMRLYLPFPKGKIKTGPEMLKTQPGDWEKDKERLIQMIDQFNAKQEQKEWPIHPFFGKLSGKAWAKLLWRHMNHHLLQFGMTL